jgi:hypothetical protein
VVPDNWSIINDQVWRGAAITIVSLVFARCLVVQCSGQAQTCFARTAVQDVVAKGQKFMIYKRPGQRVLISSQGYMLVRCSSRISLMPSS